MKHSIRAAILAVLGASATVGCGDGEPSSRGPEFLGDVEALSRHNVDFRRVLFTGPNIQVVAMSLGPNEDIGEEVHQNVDQCFFFVSGAAETIVEGRVAGQGKDGLLCVPAGSRHNIRNTGSGTLKLITTYAPPQHPPGTVHQTKADAEKAEAQQPPES
jgi:mannose-6-phosphate isomerase-like protein (cupin superfamily)